MPSIADVAVGGKVTAAKENEQSGWINASGQIGVVPTSVSVTGGGSSGSVGAKGAVTFATATSISINGCFTSAYDNYLIVVNVPTTSTSLGILMSLRLSGTDTTTGYDTQALYGFSSTAGAATGLNAASWPIAGTSTASIHDGDVKLYAPALVQATRGVATFSSITNPMTAAPTSIMQSKAILQRATTAFDGFTLTASTGTITGTVRIYGFNNN